MIFSEGFLIQLLSTIHTTPSVKLNAGEPLLHRMRTRWLPTSTAELSRQASLTHFLGIILRPIPECRSGSLKISISPSQRLGAATLQFLGVFFWIALVGQIANSIFLGDFLAMASIVAALGFAILVGGSDALSSSSFEHSYSFPVAIVPIRDVALPLFGIVLFPFTEPLSGRFCHFFSEQG